MKKIIVIFILVTQTLLIACVPVPCIPDGLSGLQQVSANISSVDSDISSRLSELTDKVNEEQKLLDEILEKQDSYIKQVSAKQVYLQNLIENSKKLTEILRVQR